MARRLAMTQLGAGPLTGAAPAAGDFRAVEVSPTGEAEVDLTFFRLESTLQNQG